MNIIYVYCLGLDTLINNTNETRTLSKQSPQLNQERINIYLQQFKAPVLTLMSNMTQTLPNTIDELVKQCVTLEGQIKTLTAENKKLLDEKVLAKTIVKDIPNPKK